MDGIVGGSYHPLSDHEVKSKCFYNVFIKVDSIQIWKLSVDELRQKYIVFNNVGGPSSFQIRWSMMC